MLEKLPDKPSFRLNHHAPPDSNKFRSKILSRETAEPSFRVYYGSGSGSVPFFWESEPGTPKHALNEANAPPLTPPPAYNINSNCINSSSGQSLTRKKVNSRSNFLRILFLKASPKSRSSRTMLFKSKSTGPDTWSSSEYSSCSSLESKENDQDSVTSSPTPILCFGARRSTSRVRS